MEAAAELEAIRKLLETYLAAWRRHDMQAWGALFTDDADFVTHAGLWWRSNAENVAGHESVPASVIEQKVSYELQVSSIRLLADGIALVHAHWYWPGFMPPTGGPAADAGGIITMVLVRRDGRWAIRASHNTKILAARDERFSRDK
ncbi:SgcJ/EcaC family oxidoreductase [Peristeroidobacter agariperforans]|uniref:SgcJ/EcaC family oxidoreductase n=1 Tax=Peristeroidobacter agariperforans TaxID=268404 RepID=UPI00101CC94E|nr:SgcJ/EcaC family oxidoreductase [Peristeroidobacter agariperforans]